MPDHTTISIGSASNAGLRLVAHNNGREDPAVYFKLQSAAGMSIQPSEVVKALIVPHDDPTMTAAEASGLLAGATQTDDVSRGLYYSIYQNETNEVKTITELPQVRLQDLTYENTKFDLYWLQNLGSQVIFDSDTSGTYSWPHNPQAQEVRIAGELINQNTRVRYNVTWGPIANEGDTGYGASGPYLFALGYRNTWYTATNVVEAVVDGNPVQFSGSLDYETFGSGVAPSGITVEVPYYDPRPTFSGVPANYMFWVNYNTPLPDQTGAQVLPVPINHQDMGTNFLADLDSFVATQLNPANLRKVNELKIDRDTIIRRRMSIGVKDIVVKQNTYKKKGVYISLPYTSEFGIYTMSMKVDEFIPDYPDLDPYNVVQYWLQFNNKDWERLSPVNRGTELDLNGNAVPKLMVFDRDPGDAGSNIRFLDYGTDVSVFRVKIVFDASAVPDAQFIPPEVRDYDCIIFDKNQLLEI